MDSDAKLPAQPSPADGPAIRGEAGMAGLVPFGLNKTKPRHFREALEVAWENRDSLGYAWNVLNQGVCDGCSLGPRGLEDDVLPGMHVCMSRLKLLRQNTVGAFDPTQLADISRLREMDNRALRALGRVPYPFIYRKGDRGFKRASWHEALSAIDTAWQGTPAERTAWFATSKGLTNETYYALTKTARLMGSNHVDFCARLCHAASVSGLAATIGYGAPTCSLSDLIGTDLILLWGTNLANNQPVAVKYLAEAKKQGTRIVVINTVREKGLEAYWIPSKPGSALFGSRLMDDFIQVKAGGDIALAQAVLKLLLQWGAVDRTYIEAHTTGFDALQAQVEGLSLDALLQTAGVSYSEAEWLAKLIARSQSMVTVWSMGLTQHRFGTQNVMAVTNLHLARGALGREKCGLLPIRGHSGVQGGGECGVAPDKLPGGIKLTPESAARFTELWGHPVPQTPGYDTAAMVEAADRGELDVMYNIGGNLFATMPDPDLVVRAFSKIKLRIHQDININTSTLLEPGELVVLLPAQTRYEQRGGGTSTNTERRIRFSPEIPGHPVVGETQPEWDIPGMVATRVRPDLTEALRFPTSQSIRDEIARVMPIYAGIEGLNKAGDWVQWGGPRLCTDGHFPNMPDGKARFLTIDVPDTKLPEGIFLLLNRRGKQFNSMIFADEDTIQGGQGRNDVFISAGDAATLGLDEGDTLILFNERGELRGVTRIAEISAGHVQTYWPEANHLMVLEVDPTSKEPDYHAHVRVRRA